MNAGTFKWKGITGTFKWKGITWWSALGILMLLIGTVPCLQAARNFNLWLYADNYVAADLEVTRFNLQPGPGGQGRLIMGVIHPGGEPVVTSDNSIAIKQFVDLKDRTGRHVPLRGEIEGQRLAVWYWPQHADVARWWHPSTVVMPGAPQRRGAMVRDVLLGITFIGVGLFCFRRASRVPESIISPAPQVREH